MSGWQRIGMWALLIPVIVYGLTVVTMWWAQEYLLFPAPMLSAAELSRDAKSAGAKEVRIPTPDGESLYAWVLEGTGDKAVLFFHGNGSTPHSGGYLKQILGPEWNVIALSYRGYGPSSGAPTEAGLRIDGQAAWDYATEELGLKPDQIVLHGRSLGAGVAIGLAKDVHPAGLVMESTFASVQEVASGQYPLLPVSWLIRHPFRSDLLAPEITDPVLLMHSSDDNFIPVAHARKMRSLLPNNTYIERPGYRHNDWMVLSDEVAQTAYRAYLADRVR